MKEYSTLFSAPMILALLAGRKANTRRMSEQWMKVKAGDMLWVRESYQLETLLEDIPAGMMTNSKDPVRYCADGFVRGKPIDDFGRTRPSIHMPKWASRITLEATEDARREPLQGISKEDAMAEGIQVLPLQSADDPSAWYQSAPGVHQNRTAQGSFFMLWDSINGKTTPVSSNPIPVRLAFRVLP